MYKIYSRKRIRIPYLNLNNKNKNSEKAIKIVIILLIAFSTIYIVLKSINPIFEILCEDEAKSIATIIANDKASEVMEEYEYDDLFSIEKDDSGNITMIRSNIFPINEIISKIAVEIQRGINEERRDDVKIPLGSFTGIKLLSGMGPNVKLKVSSMGNVETNLKSEFSAQGINQTLHRVYLQVDCQISIIAPFNNVQTKIENQILLAENVIVGQIPSSYYNLEGIEKGDTMQVIK